MRETDENESCKKWIQSFLVPTLSLRALDRNAGSRGACGCESRDKRLHTYEINMHIRRGNPLAPLEPSRGTSCEPSLRWRISFFFVVTVGFSYVRRVVVAHPLY